MSGAVLGIDTSNYTTSAALFIHETRTLHTASKLLPVGRGQLGLRQSEAVFHHTKALPEIITAVIRDFGRIPDAIAVSVRPRDAEGSYMPCFLAGSSAAHSIAGVIGAPVFEFSHQKGHIAAAAYGADKLELLGREFIAFHLSGGTTEALLVTPGGSQIFSVERIAQTLDLNAGQAVDRVGALLGLEFPAGKALEELAVQGKADPQAKPCLKDADCCLSGVVNICEGLLKKGNRREDVARTCIELILQTLDGMTGRLLQKHGKLPLLYAGGVMSNQIIQSAMREKYDANFAPPAFSRDNAAGIALLGSLQYDRR